MATAICAACVCDELPTVYMHVSTWLSSRMCFVSLMFVARSLLLRIWIILWCLLAVAKTASQCSLLCAAAILCDMAAALLLRTLMSAQPSLYAKGQATSAAAAAPNLSITTAITAHNLPCSTATHSNAAVQQRPHKCQHVAPNLRSAQHMLLIRPLQQISCLP